MSTHESSSRVLQIPAAAPVAAQQHFEHKLAVETDPADVRSDQLAGVAHYVIIDARSAKAYAQRHVPGAIHMASGSIDTATVSVLPKDALLVTYCWGPHCNAATKAAAKLAALGFRVKEMIGGIDGWIREGYPVESAPVEGKVV